MKSYLRRTAAVVLAVALSVPLAAVASPQTSNRDRDPGARIVRVIRQIQKIFRISVTDDMPAPPHPAPTPPPNTTT